MDEVEKHECVYHRDSKDFKDENKKANCWEKQNGWMFSMVLKLT